MNAQIPLLLALSPTDQDVDRTVAAARRAEEAGVTAIVLEDCDGGPEPATVLARIAAVTERIGLIGTFSPAGNDSLELARRLADLDYLSGGRVGWRIPAGTSRRGYFGARPSVAAVAPEIADAGVVESVVESVVERWSLRTELRSPQGVPVILADEGARFAAGFADVVLTEALDPEPGGQVGDEAERQRAYARATALGRKGSGVRVLAQIRVPAGGLGPDLAAELGRWAETGAADGFLLRPAAPDAALGELNRNDEKVTLRDRLGLAGPAPIPSSASAVPLVGVR